MGEDSFWAKMVGVLIDDSEWWIEKRRKSKNGENEIRTKKNGVK